VDGQTRQLPHPFMVIATMNPVEYEGTFPLPEAQLDRFALAINIGYPPAEAEADMLLDLADTDPVGKVPVIGDELRIADAITAAESVHVEPGIARYVVDIVAHTRQDRRLVLGASPRAALTVLRMAKATALIAGRNYVGPEHVKHVASAVLAHRLVLGSEARVGGITGHDVVNEALRAVRIPAL
jgi:MoxR-like ATPase